MASTSVTEDYILSDHVASGAENTHLSVAADIRATEHPRKGGLLPLVLESLEEDGAIDVVPIDLAGKSSEADAMVVASGRSSRHVGAICDKLMERLKRDAGVVPRAEGKSSADWVLIDAGDVIVHVFRPEVRDFYQLEKMWLPAPDATARPAASR